jgi:putative Mg2+ transporter-C (MgtC) family protein
MEGIWQQVGEDFTDLPSVAQAIQTVIRLLVAALLGGLLGYQREQVGKEAGLRTHMLVSLGAAFFVLVPQQAGMDIADLSRVIQGLVAGIGFLGAGAILKQSEQGNIKGLTTAAGLWLTAAIGMAAGMGRESSAIVCTLLAFAILSFLMRVEFWISAKTPKPSSLVLPPEPNRDSETNRDEGS